MIGAKGLFGKSMMPGQMQPAYSMPQNMAAQDGANLGIASPQKRGGGFFGQGGAGRAIAGSIGDALLQQSGMAPIYAPQMQFQQAMAARQAEAERQRAASLEDYRKRLGIEAEFAQPEMDDFDTAMARAGIPKGSPQYNAYAQEFAQRKAQGQDPLLQGAPVPGGGTFTGPYSKYVELYGGGGQAPSGPTRPVGGLTRISGGGVSNGTGSFRP